MKRRGKLDRAVALVAVLVATLTLMGLSQPSAMAAPGAGAATTDATCTVDKPMLVHTHGFFLPPTFESSPGGTVVCLGVMNNELLAGPADLSFFGVYSGGGAALCSAIAAGSRFNGGGTIEINADTLPFGSTSVSGFFAFARRGTEVVVVGSASGATLSGSLAFRRDSVPDCMTARSISARVTGQIALVGS